MNWPPTEAMDDYLNQGVKCYDDNHEARIASLIQDLDEMQRERNVFADGWNLKYLRLQAELEATKARVALALRNYQHDPTCSADMYGGGPSCDCWRSVLEAQPTSAGPAGA